MSHYCAFWEIVMLLQALIMQWQDPSSCIQMTLLQEFIYERAVSANQYQVKLLLQSKENKISHCI